VRTAQGIELELFRHLLVSIAEEMGAVLRKTSYSANIKERRDYSCAVYDARGDAVAMGDHMPVHLGAMPLSVQAVRDTFDLQPGDVALVNDPFRGGTHLPDITAVAPVFTRGNRPAFYVANRAHHADVGGMSPGSMPLAREIFQEGIRIPPVLIRRGGKLDQIPQPVRWASHAVDGSRSVARGNKKPSIGIPRRADTRATRLVAHWPHPLAGTTLPGQAGWRGRQPCSGCEM